MMRYHYKVLSPWLRLNRRACVRACVRALALFFLPLFSCLTKTRTRRRAKKEQNEGKFGATTNGRGTLVLIARSFVPSEAPHFEELYMYLNYPSNPKTDLRENLRPRTDQIDHDLLIIQMI